MRSQRSPNTPLPPWLPAVGRHSGCWQGKGAGGHHTGQHTLLQAEGHKQAVSAFGATYTQKQESVAESAGGESHGGEREAEVTVPEHRGGKKKAVRRRASYCVALTVPFALIKKDRRSSL